ncbi:MAG: hypothetical protein AAGK78_16215, partial [Planctomycetota bacterium]
SWQDLRGHEVRIPVDLPRFFLPAGPLADRIRAGDVTRATLHVSADWTTVTATNYYVLVPGTGPPAPAIAIQTYYDTAGMVPDASPGAQQALQPAAALAMLENLSQNPPERPTLFAFLGADALNLRGTREMWMALSDGEKHWSDALEETEARVALDTADAERLRELDFDPRNLDPARDRDLITRVLRMAEAEATEKQSQLFRLRIRDADELSEKERLQKQALSKQSIDISGVRSALRSDLASLNENSVRLDYAKRYVRQLHERLAGSETQPGLIATGTGEASRLRRRGELYAWLATATGQPTDPPELISSERRPIDIMIGLDLSPGGAAMGPMIYGRFRDITQNA